MVEGGEIVIVDENTGRKMPGRQWEDGLHQAVTAKEGLEIKAQNETMARTTYQILFNRYEKVGGMTGTCMTDASELAQVYGRGSLRVPTNRKCIRRNLPDMIFATEEQKWDGVVNKIREILAQGRPVLVGTRSIDKSFLLSKKLTDAGIAHTVLNAHEEEREAEIVKHAAEPCHVTVATNMAGRGTDIKLSESVRKAGGLFVLGTERHESRRRGQSTRGESGTPGGPRRSTILYLAPRSPDQTIPAACVCPIGAPLCRAKRSHRESVAAAFFSQTSTQHRESAP